MNEILQKREAISLLVDGQLEAAEFAQRVDFVRDHEELLATWQSYHLIGEVLRSEKIGAQDLDRRWVDNFRQQIVPNSPSNAASEQTATLQAATLSLAQYDAKAEVAGKHKNETAANHAIFRWKVATGIASVVAITGLIFNLVAPLDNGAVELAQNAPQIAPVPSQTAAAVLQKYPANSMDEPVIVLRDPHLDELLNAHQQFGANSALQMSSGFLRNATFEGAPR